ncbi:MAG: 16S rRNA (cytosine(967)-C(5))-methyltransferase RsmB [Acidobacteriota bacterium]|nr:16S rRNA (cytosine(967)-C(5))-methyltransferase RsmB [Acidobacteriota bacterium]MDH3786385.1 16S rRNA (cytosine(967)-C(5))-methyltransferase RsmB [Acidobacteriota bacterium]
MNPRPADVVTARELAVATLERVERAGAHAQPLLDRASDRLNDPRDVSLMHALVMGVLRQRRLLDHVIEGASSRPLGQMGRDLPIPLRLATFELLFLDRVPEFATVDAAVEGIRRRGGGPATGFVNAILRTIARQKDTLLPDDDAALALRYSYPDWWVERLLKTRDAESIEAMLRLGNEPPPLTVHVNTTRISVDRFVADRTTEGVAACRGEFADTAVHISEGLRSVTAPLAGGDCWVQDEAAQLVVSLLSPCSQARVLDLCAAPGGKTLQLAARYDNGSTVVAADRYWRRLRKVQQNLARCGLEAPLTAALDGCAEPWALQGRFDRVVVDAPCSGTGTLRRHPEIRWRLTEADLRRYRERQVRLLTRACERLAPGGEVVFSTCSIEREEGPDVIETVLADRDDIVVASAAERVSGRAREFVTPEGYLVTDPAVGVDGFFAAVLHRR